MGRTVGLRRWMDSKIGTLHGTHRTCAGLPKDMSMYVIPVCMGRLCDSIKWDM